MYLQNCGLRTFSYEILSKEVLACENIRFSAAKSVEKRMFSQAEEVFFFQHFFLSQSSELFAPSTGV